MTIILVRHYQELTIESNIYNLIEGKEIFLYSSSLLRCRQTTELLVRKLARINVFYSSFLNERKLGILEGKSKLNTKIKKEIIKIYWKTETMKPHGGESILEVRNRVKTGLKHIFTNENRIVFIVIHQ